jgi:glycosyltransferase involved in cell wall biosynthesis
MRILSLNNDDSAITFYRIRTPLLELAKHGHEVRLPLPAPSHRNTGPASTAQHASRLPTDEDLDWADVIVGRQLSHPDVVPLWDRWAAFAPLVYETDDDLFAVDTTNPALTAYLYPGVTDAMRHMIQTASLVTVTTPRLADRMRDEGARLCHVLPNYIDQSVIERPDRMYGIRTFGEVPLTVGWAGSTSHVGDWMACGKPIREWLLSHPEVDFHLVGTDYRPLLEVPARWTDWAEPVDYYKNLDFDIGLAPLASTDFNRSKSPVKALEYAARGIPVVASAETAYDSFIDHGVTGFLVEDQSDWLAYLEWLLVDPKTRRSMGEAAYEVAKQWTIQENYIGWEQAYQQLV